MTLDLGKEFVQINRRITKWKYCMLGYIIMPGRPGLLNCRSRWAGLYPIRWDKLFLSQLSLRQHQSGCHQQWDRLLHQQLYDQSHTNSQLMTIVYMSNFCTSQLSSTSLKLLCNKLWHLHLWTTSMIKQS